MSIELQALRDSLRRHIGVDEDDLDNEATDLLLNRSYWEIIDKFHFREKEVTATFAITAGTRLYNVPSPFEALRKLSVLDPGTGKHHVLDRMTVDVYEQNYDEDTDARDFPTHYVREGCAVRLWPTPKEALTATIKYWTTLSDLAEGSNEVPELPQNWHEIVLLGAVWRGFTEFGDYVRSRLAKAQQTELVNSSVPTEAKEEIDSHRAGIEVPGRVYDV